MDDREYSDDAIAKMRVLHGIYLGEFQSHSGHIRMAFLKFKAMCPDVVTDEKMAGIESFLQSIKDNIDDRIDSDLARVVPPEPGQ